MPDQQQFSPDIQNRIAIGRVLFMMFLTILLSGLLAPGAMLFFVYVVSFSAAIISVVMALYRGEKFWGPVLNRWDEALAYVALACLSNAVLSVSGPSEAPAL